MHPHSPHRASWEPVGVQQGSHEGNLGRGARQWSVPGLEEDSCAWAQVDGARRAGSPRPVRHSYAQGCDPPSPHAPGEQRGCGRSCRSPLHGRGGLSTSSVGQVGFGLGGWQEGDRPTPQPMLRGPGGGAPPGGGRGTWLQLGEAAKVGAGDPEKLRGAAGRGQAPPSGLVPIPSPFPSQGR